MNRTRRLMAAIGASLLVGSDSGLLGARLAQDSPQPEEPWKSDPAVAKAADDIFDWMQGTKCPDAKTQAEIASKFPKLSASTVENALKRLTLFQRTLKRTGLGTAESPYKYYQYATENCGNTG